MGKKKKEKEEREERRKGGKKGERESENGYSNVYRLHVDIASERKFIHIPTIWRIKPKFLLTASGTLHNLVPGNLPKRIPSHHLQRFPEFLARTRLFYASMLLHVLFPLPGMYLVL